MGKGRGENDIDSQHCWYFSPTPERLISSLSLSLFLSSSLPRSRPYTDRRKKERPHATLRRRRNSFGENLSIARHEETSVAGGKPREKEEAAEKRRFDAPRNQVEENRETPHRGFDKSVIRRNRQPSVAVGLLERERFLEAGCDRERDEQRHLSRSISRARRARRSSVRGGQRGRKGNASASEESLDGKQGGERYPGGRRRRIPSHIWRRAKNDGAIAFLGK